MIPFKRILVTGGAGFVGSNLARKLKAACPATEIIAFDNLKRRGSELAIGRLKAGGVHFQHGDVRSKEDLLEVGVIDLLIDCAAEPSVLAGVGGSPEYVIHTNLIGTINSLEIARIHDAAVLFLSTSRIYPVAALGSLRLTEHETRLALNSEQTVPGASEYGISEEFPLAGVRSMYGASKLASELLLQEYQDAYGIRAIINRCGVLTGPWQMGKVDQGMVVLWVAKHLYQKELAYIGYGGCGKQVRDILHIDDLFDLVLKQLQRFHQLSGRTFNVGGGREVSISLCELTELCQRATGKVIPIRSVIENRPNDLPLYISDCREVQRAVDWAPACSVAQIVEDVTRWISENRVALEPILS